MFAQVECKWVGKSVQFPIRAFAPASGLFAIGHLSLTKGGTACGMGQIWGKPHAKQCHSRLLERY
jgi:hypothetical protein